MTHDDPTPPRPSDPIFPADPRLTAYAFGELEGEDLALIEAALANDETLRAVVDELRAFGGDLTNSLAAEIENENNNANTNHSAVSETIAITPAHGLTHALPDKAALTKRSVEPKRRGVLLRFPFALSYLAPALAACLAVVFWIQHDNEARRERTLVPPVAFSLQVAEAPQASGAAGASGAANIATIASVTEASADAAPAALLAPSAPLVAFAPAPARASAPADGHVENDATARAMNKDEFVARNSVRDATIARGYAPAPKARDAFTRFEPDLAESEKVTLTSSRASAKPAASKAPAKAKFQRNQLDRIGDNRVITPLASADEDVTKSPASLGYNPSHVQAFSGYQKTREQLLLEAKFENQFVPADSFFKLDMTGRQLRPLQMATPLISMELLSFEAKISVLPSRTNSSQMR